MNNFGVDILIKWRGVQTGKRCGKVSRKLPMIGVLVMIVGSVSAMASSTPSVTISWPSGSAGTGSITLKVGTYSSTVRYGVYSSAASIASNFGGVISLDSASPVWAKGYSDGTIRMRAKSAADPGAVSVCIIPDGSSGCSQPSGTSVQTNPVLPGGPTLNSGALYGYVIQKSDGSSGYDNDGNVVGYNDTVNKQWSANYDSVNRLVSAQKWSTTTPFADPWGSVMQQFFCWKYDAVGNMTYSSTSPSSYDNSCNPNNPGQTVTSIPPVDSNNRLNGSGFASSDGGNLTSDNNATYQYDGAGRLCAVQPHVTGIVTAYLYNADGQRVASGTVNQYSNWCDFTSNSFVLNKRNVLGLDGAALTQFDNMGNSTSYVSLPGDVTATLTEIAGGSNATIYYTMHDWLGTKRLEADANGNIAETCASGAFGESLSCSGAEISNKHFTGKERDQESGLDYFGARYFGSSVGRFMSPDPLMASAKVWDPQTWNRYSYARNSPLKFIDPTGEAEVSADACAKDKSCVTVNVRVIYDKNANGGKGITDRQKAGFEKGQLRNAKDQYGNANIHLNVTYAAGEINSKGNLTGVDKGSLNVFLTDSGGPASSDRGGYAVSWINVNSTDNEDLPHEMAHQFMGDMSSTLGRTLSNPSVIDNTMGLPLLLDNVFTDVTNNMGRLMMNNVTPHLPNYPSGAPMSVFNPQAREFQNRIKPQTQPR